MSAQTTYKYSSPIGSAGGIVDLTPYAIDTFLNGEETGVMMFGVGVVQGDTPGTNVILPTADSTAAVFEGITTNNRTTEYDMEGATHIRNAKAMGVMRYGRIYARVATDVEPAYGDALYLVVSGDDAGCFTNDSGSGIAIKGRFIGPVDSSSQIAAVELFNQAQE
ncbi:MAG: hypothetical protein LUD12_10265 [Lachnospiraceae bacterium]|nr:hypothetical protein [Lachnospiraceae bacterium]